MYHVWDPMFRLRGKRLTMYESIIEFPLAGGLEKVGFEWRLGEGVLVHPATRNKLFVHD